MDENQKVLRLCTATALVSDPVPGSVIRNCATCGASVWYDPLQRNPYPDNPEQIICLDCGRLDPEMAPEIEKMEQNPRWAMEMLAQVMRERLGWSDQDG